MNNELQTFDFEGSPIRTVSIDGEPWFVGKDVAEVLGYAKPLNALATHIDQDDSLKQGVIDKLGRQQDTIIINESGMYSLVLSSKLESAKRFKRWVTSEVLPQIRKHGMYATAELLNNPDLAIQAFTALKAEREKVQALSLTNAIQAQQIAELQPKARFTDAVSASDGSILVGDLAKILNRNGINVGGTRLFNWFRENGWLCKQRGNLWNKPTQKAVERGFFEYTETVVETPNHSKINITPKVTGKGQTYFVDLFLSGKAVIG